MIKTPEDFDTEEEWDTYFKWMADNDAIPTDENHTSFKNFRLIQKYIPQIAFADGIRLNHLAKDYRKIHNICTVNGTQKYDYKNRYEKKYDAMKKIADELGVNVAKPLQSKPLIKVEITAIFKKYETDSRLLKNYVDEFIGEIQRLPNTNDVDSKLISIKKIETELQNNYEDV